MASPRPSPILAAIETPTNFLLIGNPGTGKSTILNGLAGAPLFQSGVSFGKGLTYQFDLQTVPPFPHILMDTPGLADMKMREQAAAAITKALKQGGSFKIFFVVTLQNGRVRSEDVTTMHLVLASAPIQSYGVIINQLRRAEYQGLTQPWSDPSEPSPLEMVTECLYQGMQEGKVSAHLHAVPLIDAIDGAKNAVPALPEDLEEFIATVPSVMLKPNDDRVKAIDKDRFDAMAKQFEAAITELKEANVRLSDMLQGRDEELRTLQTQLREQTAAVSQMRDKLGRPARMQDVGGFAGFLLDVGTLGLRRLL